MYVFYCTVREIHTDPHIPHTYPHTHTNTQLSAHTYETCKTAPEVIKVCHA